MKTTSVIILLFSSLRERVGTHRLEIELTGASPSTADVFDGLCEQYPTVSPYRDYVRVAINGEYADWLSVVGDGDEIALVTPVSGG